MEKSLKQEIEQRIKQSKDKKINDKASLVARILGTNTPINERDQEGSNSLFEGKVLHIEDYYSILRAGDGDSFACSTEIKYHGNVVYKQGGGTVYSYIPGPWERSLNRLYEGALAEEKLIQASQTQENKTKRRKDETEERKKWGL